ncbi:hypothetical protein [Herbaspirillum aquaticum]|uniref:hypothetical protein n=1 Tax=Herbaspirillum aquaticum TaxID=568783 RepID=UPI0024DE3C4C|nr:hypothetical protein [Herbaspirillum aquaticum]
MSDPNAQTKKRQRLLVGGALGGILLLTIAGMFLFDSGPPEKRKKPTTVTITAPGTVDDKDEWRAQQAAKEKANETLIGETKSQLKALEEQNKKMALALEELKAVKGGTGGATASPDGSALDKPLPSASGAGQRVLESPNVRGGAQTLNQPLNQVDVPQRREVEMITFETADAAKNSNGGSGRGNISEGQAGPSDERLKKSSSTSGAKDGAGRHIDFLPAGSFIRVAMLNGVVALAKPFNHRAPSPAPAAAAFHKPLIQIASARPRWAAA